MTGPPLDDAAVHAGLEAVVEYLTSRQVYVMDDLAELFRERYEAAMAGGKSFGRLPAEQHQVDRRGHDPVPFVARVQVVAAIHRVR
jgi:hypothetical protein